MHPLLEVMGSEPDYRLGRLVYPFSMGRRLLANRMGPRPSRDFGQADFQSAAFANCCSIRIAVIMRFDSATGDTRFRQDA
jgi:hypothetical protein